MSLEVGSTLHLDVRETDGTPLDGSALRPSTHTIDCRGSSLRLPVG